MRYTQPVRLLIAVGVSLGTALLLVALLYATQLAFEVWERLRTTPFWFLGLYAGVLIAGAGVSTWVLWRVLVPRRPPSRQPRRPSPPPSEEQVRQRLERARADGVDVAAVETLVRDLHERRAAGVIHVSLFGQVSTGKSSLVQALLPDASPVVDPRAGTTRAVTHYTWESPAGDRLVLTDLPGLNEPDGSLNELARDEAARAHVVVYLVDGDLTRTQYGELQALLDLGKPLILALNKADLYRGEDLELLRQRLTERVRDADRVQVVSVSAGASREVMRVYPDGREELVEQRSPPRVAELLGALQTRIDGDEGALETLRDAAVFTLAARKLDQVLMGHRRERAEALVRDSTRKAVFGALAAVSPGTDVLIQGFLGVQMVRGLTRIYEVPAGDIDVERFLSLATETVVKRKWTLVLTITGNALKSFPGVGTLTGGIVHAVAYGVLFDGLGRAVTETLENRGALPTKVALRSFEDNLSENLEHRARTLARLALPRLTAGQAGNASAARMATRGPE